MKDVAAKGLEEARRIQGYDDLWEVRAEGQTRIFRIIFAPEGHFQHVLLALHAFTKKTQRTPPQELRLAAARLTDWHRRGQES